ncbi:MAG TPA: DNA-protecting protein DprA [Ruminococcus sp.]|nr:DNA-protecting protein DprA [Ruminococcus sp.]
MNETVYWLWLSMVFGVGSRRIWEAMCIYETAEEAYTALTDPDCFLRLSDAELRNTRMVEIAQADRLLKECAKHGIGAVGYSSPEYPPRLRHIMNPPAVLFYKGNIGCLTGTRTVTAVGTRKASDYAVSACEKICGELAGNGFVIVSGFAVGIDICASMAAVARNRPTACVLGCGVDVDYPRENFCYRDAVIGAGGVFVSEFPPGTSPLPGNFPKRNRILAALSRATVVFEASAKSGSLITANLAAEQGRDVFVLPPADIFSPVWAGNLKLLRDGAEPLYSAEDVSGLFRDGAFADKLMYTEGELKRISPFTSVYNESVAEEKIAEELAERVARQKRKEQRKNSGKKKSSAPAEKVQEKEKAPAPDLSGLTDTQKKIADCLNDGPLHADIIAQRLDISAGELMYELTELEISGAVRSLPGNMYELLTERR